MSSTLAQAGCPAHEAEYGLPPVVVSPVGGRPMGRQWPPGPCLGGPLVRIDRNAHDPGGGIGYGVVPVKSTVSFPFTTSGVMAQVPRHVMPATFSAAFAPAKR